MGLRSFKKEWIEVALEGSLDSLVKEEKWKSRMSM